MQQRSLDHCSGNLALGRSQLAEQLIANDRVRLARPPVSLTMHEARASVA